MTKAPRIIFKADELPKDSRVCTCCGKTLSGRAAYLELDQRTNTYHDEGGVPADKSQGFFPFGMTCAKNKLAEHRA